MEGYRRGCNPDLRRGARRVLISRSLVDATIGSVVAGDVTPTGIRRSVVGRGAVPDGTVNRAKIP